MLLERAAQQSQTPIRRQLLEDGAIHLGSDCSGIGMDYLALKFIRWPLSIRSVFCSEIDVDKKRILPLVHEGFPVDHMTLPNVTIVAHRMLTCL